MAQPGAGTGVRAGAEQAAGEGASRGQTCKKTQFLHQGDSI